MCGKTSSFATIAQLSCTCLLSHHFRGKASLFIALGRQISLLFNSFWDENTALFGTFGDINMSFTYAHYAAPSSLPSDYAILSRYAAANTEVNDETADDLSENEEAVQVAGTSEGPDATPNQNFLYPDWTKGPRRRSSFPTAFIRPLNPNMAPLASQPESEPQRTGSKAVLPSETTPLLGPLIPRIEEEVDQEDQDVYREAGRIRSFIDKYWEEFGILLKYTLPVFGYVLKLYHPYQEGSSAFLDSYY